jgi:hypothetical protein
MTYENGKYTIYTTDGTKFEMSKEQFQDIFNELKEHAHRTNDSVWFADVIGDTTIDIDKIADDILLGYDSNEESKCDYLSVIEDTVSEIVANYYVIPITNLGDEIWQSI